jgi:hypothetical protein
MKEKTENEKTKLNLFQNLCKDAVNEYEKNHPHILTSYESKELHKLLDRMFTGELDFLTRNPADYFEIYEEE